MIKKFKQAIHLLKILQEHFRTKKNDFEKNERSFSRSSANVQVRPGTLFFLSFETP